MFIDTHTHLYADAFDADRKVLISKAINAGVQRFYLPNIDPSSVDPMMALVKEFPEHCFAMMGLHPCHVEDDYQHVLDEVEKQLETGRYVGVGEAGIDLYWDKTRLEEQKTAFLRQVQMAIRFDLPLIIHTRESFDITFQLLNALEKRPRGIFHCFTGTIEQAQQVLQLGSFKLGIGGVLTFKNSGLDKVVQAIDLKHLVLETDAPYLAPVPFRGKRNEPGYILEVARHLAAIKNLSLHQVEEATTTSAREVFRDF